MTADRDATEELLNICAGLPIALSIVGSRLASGRDDSARPLLRQLHGSPLDGFRAGDKAVSSLFGLAYDGLDDDTKSLLRSLAQLSASNFAEWVAAPLTGGAAVSLASIADHGLLQRLATDEAGQERFRMHGLTRHYVRERVELTENALPRLAASAVSRVQAAVLPYTSEGSDFRGVPDVLSMETTDIRFSASWLDGELSFLVSLVTDLTDFPHHVWRLAHLLTAYLERGLHLDEWEMVNRQALAASRAARENAGVALTLRDQGDLLRAKRDLDAAAISYQKSIGHFLRDGSEQDRARVLLRLGLVYLEQGKLRPAEENVAHAGRGFKACGDQRGEAECLRVRGMARYRDGDLETSLFSLLAALRLARNLGDRYTQASCLQELVIVQLARHEHGHAKSLAEAEMHAEQEHDLAAHRLRDPKLTAYALLSLARVAQVRQEAEAAQYAGDAATRLLNTGDILGHAWALTLLGDITGRLAEHERAHAIFSRLGDVHGMARTAPPRADGDEHA